MGRFRSRNLSCKYKLVKKLLKLVVPFLGNYDWSIFEQRPILAYFHGAIHRKGKLQYGQRPILAYFYGAIHRQGKLQYARERDPASPSRISLSVPQPPAPVTRRGGGAIVGALRGQRGRGRRRRRGRSEAVVDDGGEVEDDGRCSTLMREGAAEEGRGRKKKVRDGASRRRRQVERSPSAQPVAAYPYLIGKLYFLDQAARMYSLIKLMAMITQVLNEKGQSVETSLVHVYVLPVSERPGNCVLQQSSRPHPDGNYNASFR
ncbi:uncharacterized protein [Miscanthus floridulus]|uniref:uncharacterized protein n=1 Tax=Miscanthus floridulus TaxID=154761 RepID=UPI003459A684